MLGSFGWMIIDTRTDLAVVRRFPEEIDPMIRDKRFHANGLTEILNNHGWTGLPENRQGSFSYLPFLSVVPKEISSPDMKWMLFRTGSKGNLALAHHFSIRPGYSLKYLPAETAEALFRQNDWTIVGRFRNRWGMIWLLAEPEHPQLLMKEE